MQFYKFIDIISFKYNFKYHLKMILNITLIYEQKSYKIKWFGILRMLGSILSFVNKSLTILVLFLSTAAYNAVLLFLNKISKKSMILNCVKF